MGGNGKATPCIANDIIPAHARVLARAPLLGPISLLLLLTALLSGRPLDEILVGVSLGVLFTLGFLEYLYVLLLVRIGARLDGRMVGPGDVLRAAASIGLYFIFIGVFLIKRLILNEIDKISFYYPNISQIKIGIPSSLSLIATLGSTLYILQIGFLEVLSGIRCDVLENNSVNLSGMGNDGNEESREASREFLVEDNSP